MLRHSVFDVLTRVTMSAISAALPFLIALAIGVAGSLRDYFLLFFTLIVRQ